MSEYTPEQIADLKAQGFHFRATAAGEVRFTEAEEAEWAATVAANGPPPTVIVPRSIHKVWATMVLEAWGVMDDVEEAFDNAWAAGAKGYKRYWSAVSDIHRADPILAAFATLFGWDSDDLDQIFVQGAAYQAAAGAA